MLLYFTQTQCLNSCSLLPDTLVSISLNIWFLSQESESSRARIHLGKPQQIVWPFTGRRTHPNALMTSIHLQRGLNEAVSWIYVTPAQLRLILFVYVLKSWERSDEMLFPSLSILDILVSVLYVIYTPVWCQELIKLGFTTTWYSLTSMKTQQKCTGQQVNWWYITHNASKAADALRYRF